MRCIGAALVLFVAGLVLAAPPKVVEEFSGKVIGVTDGDTIKVLVNKETITVRLEGIDAPESGQSFGKKSKEALSEVVAGKTVTVKKTGTDKYKRTFGLLADFRHQLVECCVVASSKRKKRIWSLKHPFPDWLGDLLCQQQQLVLVGFKGVGETVDEGLAGVVPVGHRSGLDPAQVGEAHIDL